MLYQLSYNHHRNNAERSTARRRSYRTACPTMIAEHGLDSSRGLRRSCGASRQYVGRNPDGVVPRDGSVQSIGRAAETSAAMALA